MREAETGRPPATYPSGRQYEIAHGEQRATIVEVGGGVREYSVAGRAVLDPYPVDAICDGAHGAPLIPWPNRLADGLYSFDGVEHQVDLTEPTKQNAIHGFLRWRNWAVEEPEPERLLVRTVLHPLEGYPFSLEVSIAYELGDGGLVTTTTATNVGVRACPFGVGQHPYLSPGEGLIDGCTLELDAGTRIVTDPERQLPTGLEPVAGTGFDFRAPRLLGDQRLDFAFTDLGRDEDGRAWVRLRAPDSRCAELWVDEHYPIVELYTGDTLEPRRRRRGLGTEPMSCPPNAFQTGEGLVRLEPGESVAARWGARLS
ncbi:MAG TPA: aldose 1-epimerase family protein [Solirubrobacterales bacterium]|jgi:aldose 1-epimerase|nr:aldose 1-epimerase family protein [Solirubrobacterales bacterium]